MQTIPINRTTFESYLDKYYSQDKLGVLASIENDLWQVVSSRFPNVYNCIYDCDDVTLIRLKNDISSKTLTSDSSSLELLHYMEIFIQFIRHQIVKISIPPPNPSVCTTSINDNSFRDTYLEGKAESRMVTRYERDKEARRKCIQYYGCKCYICGFDFEKFYGSECAGYIEVHHIEKISVLGKEHIVDPIMDLRPLCSNCHSMVHHCSNVDIERLRNKFNK